MEVPDDLAEEFNVAIQLQRLWREHPDARLIIEPVGGAYRASITAPDGPSADGHAENAMHALSRALTHLGLTSDLADYP